MSFDINFVPETVDAMLLTLCAVTLVIPGWNLYGSIGLANLGFL